MDNFIVSARKYRPQTFKDVVGQKHITDTLVNEINSNQLAQAFLFTGPRGVGKTTCARILSKVINSDENTKPDQDFAFNIFELDAASNNSVDDIRSLNEQVRMPPQTGKYKVYIIDEVHMLSTSAFNAFLKTLEEPPPYAIFILATTEKHKILPTILSRCQIFNFNRIKVIDIVEYLSDIAEKEKIDVEKEALHIIAQKADGGMRDALSMFDQLVSFCNGTITYEKAIENLNLLDADYYFKITDALLGQNAGKALVLFDEILEKGFDGHQFLIGLNDHFRNLMMVKDTQTHLLLEVSENIQEKYQDQASKAEYGLLLNALNVVHKFEYEYRMAGNKRLHIELCLMKLNALPYLMKGEIATEERGKVMEFKSTLIIPVRQPKQQRVAAPKTGSKKALVPNRLKSLLPNSQTEPKLISEAQLQAIPVINYTKKPVIMSMVAEVATSTDSGKDDNFVSESNLAFNNENVRKVLDNIATYLVEHHNKKSTGNFFKKWHFALTDNKIIFDFSAKIEEKQFRETLPEIAAKLKAPFLPLDIFIESIVTVTESEAKTVFAPNSKLKKMLEESEAVNLLAKAFNLGIKP